MSTRRVPDTPMTRDELLVAALRFANRSEEVMREAAAALLEAMSEARLDDETAGAFDLVLNLLAVRYGELDPDVLFEAEARMHIAGNDV